MAVYCMPLKVKSAIYDNGSVETAGELYNSNNLLILLSEVVFSYDVTSFSV